MTIILFFRALKSPLIFGITNAEKIRETRWFSRILFEKAEVPSNAGGCGESAD